MTGLRVVLATFGSLGDVHPYVALGKELLRRGHRPAIATSEHWRSKVEGEGLDFFPVRPDAPDPDAIPEFMARVFDLRRGPEFVVKEVMMPSLREGLDDTRRAAEGADLLVSHPLSFAVPLVAELSGVPWASSVLAPLSFLSAHDPPDLGRLPGLAMLRGLGPSFHRPLFRVLSGIAGRWVRPIHELRAELGLRPVANPLFEGQHAPRLVLAMYSRLLGGPQPDWPSNVRITGFCFFDRDATEDAPPEEVARFLDDGPPPVVFTLGSSAVWVGRRFYRESIEAIRRSGRRAIVLTGPGGAEFLPDTLPEGVAAFAYAPYSTLFPRCAAIVHQGGVGTTAQALRAGRPMLVVPFGFDQHDNAARVARLGIARVLRPSRYNAARAGRALEALLGDPDYATRALEVGRDVALEEGPGAAAEAIEQLFSDRRIGA